MRLTILHTNDLHGHQERMAQIATLVRRERECAEHTVLYLDAGDVEETTNRLSNHTKGTAMHRILSRTTCDAATVGNACWIRYGPEILAEHARASSYPQLLANFEPVIGPVPSARFGQVGVFGLTAPFRTLFTDTDWGFEKLDELEVARRVSRELRRQGATLIVFLSHLGLDVSFENWDDRRIAHALQDEVDVIIGGHTHDLLPGGEWIGRVLVTQAGQFGEHLGRIEVDGDTITASVEPLPSDTPPDPAVLEEIAVLEDEVSALRGHAIGVSDAPIDAAWIAEMLRVRMGAEVGLFTEGLTLATIPAGTVTRGDLFDASEAAANPGVTRMTGAQLLDLLARGNDPAFTRETIRPLRGRVRGRIELAGLTHDQIDGATTYTVAGSDWELDAFAGYALEEWELGVTYDFPIIIREAIEEHLRRTTGP